MPEPETPAGPPSRARDYVLVRHRRNLQLLLKFSLVGGSGFVVNMVAYAVVRHLLGWDFDRELLAIPGTEFHVRAYHLYSSVAFIVANGNNYVLNRYWTFQSHGTAHWIREYIPFLLVGVLAQLMVLGILTVLLHPGLIGLDSDLVAQFIAIVVVTPLSFAGNKVWTFSRVRERDRARAAGK